MNIFKKAFVNEKIAKKPVKDNIEVRTYNMEEDFTNLSYMTDKKTLLLKVIGNYTYYYKMKHESGRVYWFASHIFDHDNIFDRSVKVLNIRDFEDKVLAQLKIVVEQGIFGYCSTNINNVLSKPVYECRTLKGITDDKKDTSTKGWIGLNNELIKLKKMCDDKLGEGLFDEILKLYMEMFLYNRDKYKMYFIKMGSTKTGYPDTTVFSRSEEALKNWFTSSAGVIELSSAEDDIVKQIKIELAMRNGVNNTDALDLTEEVLMNNLENKVETNLKQLNIKVKS